MKTANEILAKYSAGELTAEQANAELKEVGAGYSVNPDKTSFTPEQIADGWGLLDSGTETCDPARMVDGHLETADCGDMKAFFFHNGKTYKVSGTKLEEV